MDRKRVGKVRPSDIAKKERYRMVGEFFDIVDGLKRKQDITDFFIGLLTPSESLMLARRIQIAKSIIKGESYDAIRRKLHVGNSTIAGVDKWLQMRDGRYEQVLQRHYKRTKPQRSNRKGLQYKSALDRYPQHRMMKKMLGLD